MDLLYLLLGIEVLLIVGVAVFFLRKILKTLRKK